VQSCLQPWTGENLFGRKENGRRKNSREKTTKRRKVACGCWLCGFDRGIKKQRAMSIVSHDQPEGGKGTSTLKIKVPSVEKAEITRELLTL